MRGLSIHVPIPMHVKFHLPLRYPSPYQSSLYVAELAIDLAAAAVAAAGRVCPPARPSVQGPFPRHVLLCPLPLPSKFPTKRRTHSPTLRRKIAKCYWYLRRERPRAVSVSRLKCRKSGTVVNNPWVPYDKLMMTVCSITSHAPNSAHKTLLSK